MILASRLQSTLELLSEVKSAPRPADAVTSGWFRDRRHINDADRGAILELIYALLRHQARLGWWLARQQSRDTPRNRLLIWLALVEGQTPDQIKRLFESANLAPAALSQPEYALTLSLRGCAMGHADMPQEVR